MKKIKLMLVAFMAMIGVNAMAQPTTADIGIWKVEYTSVNNGAIIGFKNDIKATDVKDLVFPATLDDTENGVNGIKIVKVGKTGSQLSTKVQDKIETVDFSQATNLTTLSSSAFKNASALTTVTFGTEQTTIGGSVFNNCISLKSVVFPEGSKLSIIFSFAFGTTPSLTELDFSNCSKLVYFTNDGTAGGTETNPFIPKAGEKNTELKKITLSSETVGIGTALANLAALTTVNLSSTKVTDIANGAFANDAALTELTTPATLLTITGTPFAGCTKLATLTIDGKELTTLGTTATSLYGATDADKAALKSLYITGNVKAAIFDGILNSCTALTTVEIAKGNNITGTLSAGAIAVAKNASITLGKLSVAAAAGGAFITAGDGSTLTIEEIAVAQPNEIVHGKIAATVGAIGAVACSLDAFSTNATGLTFTGNIGAAFTAYSAANGDLASIDFGSVKLVTQQIPTAANGTTQGTPLAITWTPAEADAIDFIAQDAFAGGPVGAGNGKVTLTTSLKVGELYGFSEANVYNVIFNSSATALEIEVAHKNATYYYGSFYYPTVNFKIAKAQNGGKVMVYGSYVDQSDNTVYMDQLKVIEGYYYVPAATPVIIKSSTGDKVKAEFNSDGTITSLNTIGGARTSEIHRVAAATVATTLAADGTVDAWGMKNADHALLYLYPFASFDLYWNTLTPSAKVPEGTFYLLANKEKMASGARINVVWLDGSEEATAIQTVKKVAENGAIYNLAGQKVNASYKGVVIKDGKKYIQK